jgi:PAS domain S-box-containing protein
MASVGSEDEDVPSGGGDERCDGGFFETLVRNSSDAVVSVDEEGTIVFANDAVETQFGYDPDELVGESVARLLPERCRDGVADAVEQLTTADACASGDDVERTVRHRDGRDVPVSIAFTEHHAGDDQLVTGIVRNVSRRVAHRRRLERKVEQLERFVTVVSHDLRTPLQLAQGQLTAARRTLDADCEALADVADAHDRMDRLVGNLLELAKQGQIVGETEPVDVGVVAREAWRTAGDDAHTLSVSAATVRADRERLRTLFENLFRNVRTHAGPDVTVRVAPLDDEPGFFVDDDGVGFEDDADVFDREYASADSEMGFGLSIVQAVARAHGWEVCAMESDAGGARFEFLDVAVVDEDA